MRAGLVPFGPGGGPFEDGDEVAVQRRVRLAPLLAGREDDALDQTPDGVRGLDALLRPVQRFRQARHPAAVDRRDVGVNIGQVGRGGGEPGGNLVLARLQRAQPVRHAPHIAAVLDGRDHRGDLLLDGGELLPVARARGPALAVEPVGLLRIGPHRLLRRLRRHQAVPEAGHDPLLDDGAPDAPAIGATAGLDVPGADVAVRTAQRVTSAAHAAEQKPGEQIPGPVGAVQPVRVRARVCVGRAHDRNDVGVLLGQLLLPVLHRLPQLVIDDAKLGNLGDDPLLRRVDPRHLAPGLRVLHEALAVPHQTADVEVVVEQPRAPLRMAPDGRVRPELPCRARNALRVQPPRNRARAHARGELPEDTAHDAGLRLVDRPLAPDEFARSVEGPHHVVAVAHAAARLALLHPAPDPPMGLRREVLQEQRVHRALQADVKLVDLALGERDERHSGEAQVLVEDRNVGLVAAHPVERLGDHDLEPAAPCVFEQRLDAGAQDDARARDRRVPISVLDLPALALRLLAADAELVLDGGRPLLVGRIAGIERTVQGHGLGSPIVRAPPCPAHCRWRLGLPRSARARSAARAAGQGASRQRRSGLPARRCRSQPHLANALARGRCRLAASPPPSRYP